MRSRTFGTPAGQNYAKWHAAIASRNAAQPGRGRRRPGLADHPHAYLAARLLGRQPVVGESPVQAEVHVHDEVGAVVVEKTSPFCVVADQCSLVPVHAR
jgi:hypothetical protein